MKKYIIILVAILATGLQASACLSKGTALNEPQKAEMLQTLRAQAPEDAKLIYEALGLRDGDKGAVNLKRIDIKFVTETSSKNDWISHFEITDSGYTIKIDLVVQNRMSVWSNLQITKGHERCF